LAAAMREADIEPRIIPPAERRYTDSAIVPRERGCAHVKDAFRMLGFDDVETMDYSDAEGADHIHDLNEPVPQHLLNRFDVLLDVGVMEHICDIRQAIENSIRMLKVGGRIILHLPLFGWHNMVFFNFQPPFLTEVYAANGFADIRTYINYWPNYREWDDRPLIYREFRYGDDLPFTKPHYRTNLILFARKDREVVPFVKPIQGFYERYHARESPLHRSNGDSGSTQKAAETSNGLIRRCKLFVRRNCPYWFNAMIWSALRSRELRRTARAQPRAEWYL
jgi:SAM-dependent methyltransferase